MPDVAPSITPPPMPPNGMRDTRPVPDPTMLTTQQLVGAIGALRELFEARLDGMEKTRDARLEGMEKGYAERLDGMDKAIVLLQRTADMLPSRMDEKVEHLKEVHGVKFESIAKQFDERDVRTEQTSRSAETAVNAALQAAKEAVGKQSDSFTAATQKSEDAFTKQIDQLGRLIESTGRGTDDKINDLKERVTRIESVGVGTAVARTTQQASAGLLVSIAFGVVGALIGAAGLISAFAR